MGELNAVFQDNRNSYVQEKLTGLFRSTLAPRGNDITICRRERGERKREGDRQRVGMTSREEGEREWMI